LSTSRGDLQREIALEQAHIDRVYKNLAASTASARALARSGAEIYKTDRDDYLREESGTALFERDAFAYQAAKRLAILDAEHEGLVFGRLDLNFPETRYIGRLGVRDAEYEPLVIDWRAPAAEPFYRATQASPMNVIRRRVLRCRDDHVIGLEDDLLDTSAETDLPILGEGALMAALTRARGRTMRDIVATIQAEQDEAIRAPYQGVTIIGGGPGTGKTVVALHRAAYRTILTVQQRGSGADLAASLAGGIIAYQNRPFTVITPLPAPPSGLSLRYAGYKTPTAEVLARIAASATVDPEYYRDLYDRMGASSARSIAAAERGDWADFYHELNQYQEHMTALGVCDHTQAEHLAAARPLAHAVKISGSGLGDCILALADQPPPQHQAVVLAKTGVRLA